MEAERAVSRVILEDRKLNKEDVRNILNAKREIIEREGIIEYFNPEDTLGTIGGMDNLKRWLAKRKGAFTKDAKALGLRPPKGILLIGIQGCGKSLIAKSIAKEWGLPLLKLDPGKIYDKYLGESEKSFYRVTHLAESLSPVIMWIDEIEKGFSYSSSGSEDSGVSQRIFGAFLSWLQEKEKPVFVVATANDISALPSELLRKGRFDEIFFVDLPTEVEREEIFKIQLKKREQIPDDLNLKRLAQATDGFSGAEIEQAIISALYSVLSTSGKLTTEVIEQEIRETKPLSVTMKERIQQLREWAKERTVPAR